MRRWSVASGLLETDGRMLLVANRRRNGNVDWSPPGGVIDDGEHELEALTREVQEETGLRVAQWNGPLYEINVLFSELQWDLRVVVYRAESWEGEIVLDDPDGIVHDACWFEPDGCRDRLQLSPRWVRDPILEWILEPWQVAREFRYHVEGTNPSSLVVSRLAR
jgi:8-oxo-dGTP diphosphatase